MKERNIIVLNAHLRKRDLIVFNKRQESIFSALRDSLLRADDSFLKQNCCMTYLDEKKNAELFEKLMKENKINYSTQNLFGAIYFCWAPADSDKVNQIKLQTNQVENN